MVRDRALVAQDRVALALRAQLHRGHLRHVPQRPALTAASAIWAFVRFSIGGGDQRAISASASSMSSTSIPPVT